VGASPAPAWSLTDSAGKQVSMAEYKGRPLVLIFYEGSGCIRCQEQLINFAGKIRAFSAAGIDVVAIGTDTPEELKNSLIPYQERAGFPSRCSRMPNSRSSRRIDVSISATSRCTARSSSTRKVKCAGGTSATSRSTIPLRC